MVSPTATWPAVKVNGSRASNSSAMPPGTCGRGMAGRAAAAIRRWASAACSMNASSHLSRLRARSRAAQSTGGGGAREEGGQHQLGAVVGDDRLAPRAEVAIGHRVHADVIDAGQHGDVVAL